MSLSMSVFGKRFLLGNIVLNSLFAGECAAAIPSESEHQVPCRPIISSLRSLAASLSDCFIPVLNVLGVLFLFVTLVFYPSRQSSCSTSSKPFWASLTISAGVRKTSRKGLVPTRPMVVPNNFIF